MYERLGLGSGPIVIPEIVSLHAEEAAFLWLLRDDAVHAPHYALKDRQAGRPRRGPPRWPAGRWRPRWEIAKTALDEIGEPGEVFAAGVLAFESGEPERIQEVIEWGPPRPRPPRADLRPGLAAVSAGGEDDQDTAGRGVDGRTPGRPRGDAAHRKTPGPDASRRRSPRTIPS